MNDDNNLLAKGMMQNMAKAMGVDLAKAMADGLLTCADHQQMVWRCDDCYGKSHCWNWLALSRAADAPQVDAPNCPNHPHLADLQASAVAS